jgi:TonB family protein
MWNSASWFVFLICCQTCVGQEIVFGPEGDCGFSKFRPLRISHYIENSAATKVTPQYPPAAKANGIEGTVRVQVLVNSQGMVEKTCPEYVKGEARPDRSLVVAAETAALQWSFSPNFGIKSSARGRPLQYASGVLIFRFVPGEPVSNVRAHDYAQRRAWTSSLLMRSEALLGARS